jgi:hypothetical protein
MKLLFAEKSDQGIRAKTFALPCPAGQAGQGFKKNFTLPCRAGQGRASGHQGSPAL